MVQGLGLRVYGFRVESSGCDLGFRGLGLGVLGLEFRI